MLYLQKASYKDCFYRKVIFFFRVLQLISISELSLIGGLCLTALITIL